MTRVAITMLTFIKSLPVVVSTISVNGCVRTAKIAALYHVQKKFDRKVDHLRNNLALFNDELYQKYCLDFERQKDKIKQME